MNGALRRATSADVAAIAALQHAAYAGNREVLGVEPLPLSLDYRQIPPAWEVWLAERTDGLAGVLILDKRADDLLLWSVATAPASQGRGLGNRLLAFAEHRAQELGLSTLRLYTGEKLARNIAWYERHGFVRERTEALADRRIVHMVKHLAGA